jgi:hypothetical protein
MMLMMLLLYMKAIHTKTKENGGNIDQDVGEGKL